MTDFELFAREHLPRLLRYAVMLTGDRELAQDLVQDVMVKAQRHWDKVVSADHPDRYVTRMVTHAFLSWRRRWSVRHILPFAELPESPVPDELGAQIDAREDMWQRLAKLPPRQRAVLVLRYYERLNDAEIAELLDCKPGTVRGYAHRALATLRLELTVELNSERA